MGLQQLLLAKADFQNQLIHFQSSRMTGVVVVALAAISFFAACYLAIRCLNLFKNDQIEKNKKKISAVIPMKNSIESSGEKKIQGLLKERSIDSSVVFGALNAPNIPLNPPSTIYIGQQAPMQVDLKATSLQSVSSSPPSNHSLKLQEKIDQSLQDLQNRVVTTETLKDCIEVASQLDPKNDDRNKILDLVPCHVSF